jgi:hypothetical protein
MQTADVAITRPSLLGLPQFGSVVFEDASLFWQTGKMSKWCQIGTLGRTGKNLSLSTSARNAWSGNVVQEQ